MKGNEMHLVSYERAHYILSEKYMKKKKFVSFCLLNIIYIYIFIQVISHK